MHYYVHTMHVEATMEVAPPSAMKRQQDCCACTTRRTDTVLERAERVRVRAHVLLGEADAHLVDAREGLHQVLQLRGEEVEALLRLGRVGHRELLRRRQQVLLLDVWAREGARRLEQPVEDLPP